jgi:CheY-like chemotaxis protein
MTTVSTRSVLRQILEDSGHRVVEAAHGQEGLEYFRSRQPDLVVTDIRMPGFDGGEVIRRLRAMSKTVRILDIGCGDLRQRRRETARKAGANGILSTLGPLDQILATIDRILRSPAN